MTRILLAGSTGVVGRRLVPLLVEAGHHVTALTRRPDPGTGSARRRGAPRRRRCAAHRGARGDGPRRRARGGGAPAHRPQRGGPHRQPRAAGDRFAPDGLRADDARAGRLVADRNVTSFLHVDDAAPAAVAALDWPSGAVNICDDEPASALHWVPAFCDAVGAPPPPVSEAPRPAWARGADNRRARERLGWKPEHPTWRPSFALTAAAR